MKRFNQWVLRFGVLLALICGAFYALNQYLFQKIVPELSEDDRIVSCGVSFSQFSLSDSIIPHFRNASMKGKSGLGIYLTAQKIIENNSQVEALICDASILGLPIYRDYKFYLPVFAPSEFETVYPLIAWKDIRTYPINYKYFFKSQMRNEWVPNWRYIKNFLHNTFGCFDFQLPYIGNYAPQTGNHLEGSRKVFSKRLKQMQGLTGETAPMSTIDVHYTDSLVQYCQQKEVNLIFYCAPVHHEFISLIPSEYRTKFKESLNLLENQPGVKVLNFSDLDLDDDCFFNANHLNNKGAEIVSKMMRDSLAYFEHSKLWDEF